MEAEQVGITQLEMGDHLLTRAIEAFCSTLLDRRPRRPCGW